MHDSSLPQGRSSPIHHYGSTSFHDIQVSLQQYAQKLASVPFSWALAHVKLGLRATMAGSSQVVMLPWKMAAATGALSWSVLLLWNSGETFA